MVKTTKSDEELLEQHGITKQVKIPLLRLNPNSFLNPIKWQKKKGRKQRPRRDENPYKCSHPNCEYQNALYNKVTKHVETHHVTERTHKCHVCSKAYKSPAGLKSHLIRHSDGKKFACKFPGCSSKFFGKFELKNHESIHTGEKAYECSFCGRKFLRKDYLWKHMQTHKGEKKEFSCDKCDYVGSVSSNLKAHIKRKHTDTTEGPSTKPFQCPHLNCKFSAFWECDLKKHSKIHLEVKPLSCSFCEFKCAARSTLANHVATHTQEKPYSCSMCDFKAVQKSDVDKHFKRRHTSQVRNYKCSFCPHASYSKSDLYSHIRTHTGEKPFSCTFCSREFTDKKGKTIHENSCKRRPDGVVIKPFKCQFCEKALSQRLRKIHHEMCCKKRPDGEVIKPYKCQFCHRGFTWTNRKKEHERICPRRPGESEMNKTNGPVNS